jgi:hypothetical protein
MTAVKRTLLAVLGAAVGVLVATVLVAWAFDRPAHEVPGWLEAFSTFAAFGAASVAVVFAREAFRIESGRDQRWYDEQRSAQASLVAAWVGSHERPWYNDKHPGGRFSGWKMGPGSGTRRNFPSLRSRSECCTMVCSSGRVHRSSR